MALPKVTSEKQMALVIVFQTLAANLGSMCTPVGNPQNLYLYFYYGMDLSSFLLLLLPYSLVSFLLLALSLFQLPGTPIPISVRLAARRTRNLPVLAPSRQLWILGGMFFLSLLAVAHVLDYRLALAFVVVVTALTRPRYFRYADYRLLGTFVAFFILVGNLSQLSGFRALLTGYLDGHEFLMALLASQVISNVPAAVLLSGFTDDVAALLVGTDIGGLGTLVASMASLISYGMYVRACPRQQVGYLKLFTLLNLIYLLVLVLLACLCHQLGL